MSPYISVFFFHWVDVCGYYVLLIGSFCPLKWNTINAFIFMHGCKTIAQNIFFSMCYELLKYHVFNHRQNVYKYIFMIEIMQIFWDLFLLTHWPIETKSLICTIQFVGPFWSLYQKVVRILIHYFNYWNKSPYLLIYYK
jgi:hypothetical protein